MQVRVPSVQIIGVLIVGLLAHGLAHAQTTPKQPVMKTQELKTALFGIRMEGVMDGTDFRWRECIDPKGKTLYETPDGEMRGQLTITAKGQACFAYEDDGFRTPSCFVMRRSVKGFHFEGDFGVGFTTTKVEGDVRTCDKQDLVG